MELFDEPLAEVQSGDVRYILRRNPQRAQELEASRASKLRKLHEEVAASNAYLAGHPRVGIEAARRRIVGRIAKLKMTGWLEARGNNREVELVIDEEALREASKLDGCYVLKTDLQEAVAGKQIVHARYKDLAKVEWAFRTSKTVELEMRPIHVRLDERTRGHALVVMLAYRLVAELAQRWASLNETVEEAIGELNTLCAHEVWIEGNLRCAKIPRPRDSVARLLELAGVILPEAFPSRGTKVATRKNLAGELGRFRNFADQVVANSRPQAARVVLRFLLLNGESRPGFKILVTETVPLLTSLDLELELGDA